MKKAILALGFLYLISCTKTETPVAPPPIAVSQEESVKFTTNLDTGTYNVTDTLPLVITVSSKIPAAGFAYSIITIWSDSSKQIFKLDTSLSSSSLSLNIPGLKNSGNYTLSISVTSKSTSSNTLNKSIPVVNNPLGRFMGYKVAANARQLAQNYWQNTPVMGDLVVAAFQKGVNRNNYGTFLDGFTYGDMNGDGFIDIFNPGQFYIQTQAKFAFLIWNPITKIFENKNLFNDKSFSEFGRNKGNTIPCYLNNDNFTDFVIADMGDESNSTGSNIEPIRLAISDGQGGYDLKAIETNEKDSVMMIDSKIPFVQVKDFVEVGDLNGDGLPELVVSSTSVFYIYWGIASFPYFTTNNRAIFAADDKNFGKINNNGFGERAPLCANQSFRARIVDFNKDGKNDIVLCSAEDINNNLFPTHNRILINLGNGRFNNSSVINLPDFDPTISSYGNEDMIVDDLNGDGLNDIIAVNRNSSYRNWNIFAYIQQSNGSFIIDKGMFQYTIHTARLSDPQWKHDLIYFDFNGDGKKDISYRNAADNPGVMQKKSVFIRQGNQFIEQDYFQFDPYAKSILTQIR